MMGGGGGGGANYQHLKADFNSGVAYGGLAYAGTAQAVAGYPPALQAAALGAVVGNEMANTPEYTYNLWTTYQLTPQWRVGGGINFRGPQTPNRNPGWIVPHFVTGDLMAEYVVTQDKLTVKANITNVTNKLYADQLYSGHYVPGAGRTIQVTTSLKF